MTRIVNSWNEWDPLRRVILGRPQGTNFPAVEPAWQYDYPDAGFPLGTWAPFPEEMVQAAAEQMDHFATLLERRGIQVDRPTIHPCMFNRAVSTPDWTQLNCYGANNVRDQFLCHGNLLIEGAGCMRARWYEYLNVRPLFEKYFNNDPGVVWFSAPKPRLTDESYVPNYYHQLHKVWTTEEKKEKFFAGEWQLTEKEPLWDAADIQRYGKDIFVLHSSVTNRSGLRWLKQTLEPLGIRVHRVELTAGDTLNAAGAFHPRHIDGPIVPLRPGLAIYCPEEAPRTPELFELFKRNDWELVAAAPPVVNYNHRISLSVLPLTGTSWISTNVFSLDPKTVCVQAGETLFCEQLCKLGFEVIEVPYDKVVPFGGGLHCSTLDICREGVMEDYFPNQVDGY